MMTFWRLLELESPGKVSIVPISTPHALPTINLRLINMGSSLGRDSYLFPPVFSASLGYRR
jgi:hypothetical protein